MERDDDIAIELAAERRRYDEAERARLDAARAELPRALRQDARERWEWVKTLGRRVMRRMGR